MAKKYHLENQKIYSFTVKKLIKGMWECHCECGKIKMLAGRHIALGRYKSCGCMSNPNREEYLENFKRSFWKRVKINTNGCKEWTGNKRNGYGRIGYKRKLISCHRLVWEWKNGKISEDYEVCHRCDNPSCVNLSHLFLGTHADNIKDCVKKDRLDNRKGSCNVNSKLSEEKIKNIRTEIKNGKSIKELSLFYKVTKETIYRIDKKKNWKHVL